MEYKYKGTTYNLYLNDKGLVAAKDQNNITITGATVEAVQAELRAGHQKEQEAKQYDCLVYSGYRGDDAKEAKTKFTHGSHKRYIWVTYKDTSRHDRKRETVNEDLIYADNPNNRQIFATIKDYNNQVAEIEKLIDKEEEKLEHLSPE